MQEKAENKGIRYRNVKGTDNSEDLMATALAFTCIEMAKYMLKMGLEGTDGRTERSLGLQFRFRFRP